MARKSRDDRTPDVPIENDTAAPETAPRGVPEELRGRVRSDEGMRAINETLDRADWNGEERRLRKEDRRRA